MRKPKVVKKTILELGSFWDLTETERDNLAPFWGEDYESISFDREALIDSTQFCGDFTNRGIEPEQKNAVPAKFWKNLGRPDLKRKILAFWKRHPKGEVVFD